MKFRYKRAIGGVLAALACLTAGVAMAQQDTQKPNPRPTQDTAKSAGAVVVVPVSVTLKTDKKTYASHEPINMTMTVKTMKLKEATPSPVRLDFSSGQRYDFEIRTGKGGKGKGTNSVKVWQWSEGMMFTQMLSSQTLQPDKPLTYTQTFDPVKAKGGPLKPGTYTIIATLTTSGRTPRPTGSETITVK